jgi:hypothetical protein
VGYGDLQKMVLYKKKKNEKTRDNLNGGYVFFQTDVQQFLSKMRRKFSNDLTFTLC